MSESPLGGAHVPRLRKLCLLIAGLSLAAPHVHSSYAQEPAAAYRISVASTVTPACGGGLTRSVLQEDAEARLRGAGVTVSSVHNAQLAVDIDCVAVARNLRNGGMAVHQCLGFSELVSAPSQSGRAMLATTWRKCESYTCSGAKCGPVVRAGLQTLVNGFLTDAGGRRIHDPAPAKESVVAPPAVNQTPVAPPAVRQPAMKQTTVAQSAVNQPAVKPASATQRAAYSVPRPGQERVIVYLLYIMACLGVLLNWQCKSLYSFS